MNKVCRVMACCLLIMMISMTALAREITMQDLMEANSVSSLLERHSSVALLQSVDGSQNAVWLNRLYRYSVHRQDETMREGDAEYLVTKDQCLVLSYIQFSDGVYPVPFLMLDVGLGESIYYDVETGAGTELLYEPEMTSRELIQSIEDNGKTLTLTTWLTGQDFIDGWNGNYQAGSYCELVYTLDSETLELQEDVETVLDAKGRPLSENLYYQIFDRSVLQTSQKVIYDAPLPADAALMMEHLNNSPNADAKDARTVTYILYPGTPEEKVISVTGARGYGVVLASGDNEYELYTDPALTEPAQPDDLKSDRQVYVKLITPEKDKT